MVRPRLADGFVCQTPPTPSRLTHSFQCTTESSAFSPSEFWYNITTSCIEVSHNMLKDAHPNGLDHSAHG